MKHFYVSLIHFDNYLNIFVIALIHFDAILYHYAALNNEFFL